MRRRQQEERRRLQRQLQVGGPRLSLPKLADPGWTPGRKELHAVLDLLASPEREPAELAEKALIRAGEAAVRAVVERLATAAPPARARLVRVLGRLAAITGDAALHERLLGLLDDADDKARRAAIIALGKLGGPGVEAGLLARWNDASSRERRSLAEALGKVGGAAALALLRRELERGHEHDLLGATISRARLMLERTLGRASSVCELEHERELPEPVTVILRCRPGLSRVLLDEARALGDATRRSRAEVALAWRGALGPLAALRTALDFGLELPLRVGSAGGLESAVAALLGERRTVALLGSWSRGPIRFRLAFEGAGHRRAAVWKIAELVARQGAELTNDPTGASWEVLVSEHPTDGRLLLLPRVDDTRFSYRARDVPAASHPTVAAALVRVAGARADDVVWDPFVGSGLELVERARLGPCRRLLGSDTSPTALAAARDNLARAGVSAELALADARNHRPRGVTCIVTNPPMGRRVARDGTLAPQLDAFLVHAEELLGHGGRLVWLSPFPDRTARTAQRLGFRVERLEPVDLGGFEAELQILGRA